MDSRWVNGRVDWVQMFGPCCNQTWEVCMNLTAYTHTALPTFPRWQILLNKGEFKVYLSFVVWISSLLCLLATCREFSEDSGWQKAQDCFVGICCCFLTLTLIFLEETDVRRFALEKTWLVLLHIFIRLHFSEISSRGVNSLTKVALLASTLSLWLDATERWGGKVLMLWRSNGI